MTPGPSAEKKRRTMPGLSVFLFWVIRTILDLRAREINGGSRQAFAVLPERGSAFRTNAPCGEEATNRREKFASGATSPPSQQSLDSPGLNARTSPNLDETVFR